ncbi:MAG: hypothetical protein EOO73_26375 [Myxococcales bacterium]|nr:MAG: hypothetical protein EOO73_26375 [Myxococcales bacterium]
MATIPFAELAPRLAVAPASEVVVAVVAGHGAELGLVPKGAGAPFQPAALFAAIRSVPEMQVGVAVLTQCFGGIFNYTDADTKPPLVVMGGASLNLSLSMPVRLSGPLLQASGAPGLKEWSANVFSYDFFEWVGAPRDVDGDGAVTILDAFKYAGARSNGRVRESKMMSFVGAQKGVLATQAAFDSLQAALKTTPPSPDLPTKQLTFDAAITQLQEQVEFLYSNHEPWILNARLARALAFSL